jgi:hypothetical protein
MTSIELDIDEFFGQDSSIPSDVLRKIEHYYSLGFTIPSEFFDFLEVFAMGAKKHGPDNWLTMEGSKCSHKDMCASAFRHAAEMSVGQQADHESGLHPALHLAARAVMEYTRRKKVLFTQSDLKDASMLEFFYSQSSNEEGDTGHESS